MSITAPDYEKIQVSIQQVWLSVDGIIKGDRVITGISNDPYIAGQYVSDALNRDCTDVVVHVKTS